MNRTAGWQCPRRLEKHIRFQFGTSASSRQKHRGLDPRPRELKTEDEAYVQSSDGRRTLRRRSDGSDPLPISPLLDPIVNKRRRRYELPKPLQDRKELSPFQQEIASHVYARMFSSPIRLDCNTDLQLPSSFLQSFTVIRRSQQQQEQEDAQTPKSRKSKQQPLYSLHPKTSPLLGEAKTTTTPTTHAILPLSSMKAMHDANRGRHLFSRRLDKLDVRRKGIDFPVDEVVRWTARSGLHAAAYALAGLARGRKLHRHRVADLFRVPVLPPSPPPPSPPFPSSPPSPPPPPPLATEAEVAAAAGSDTWKQYAVLLLVPPPPDVPWQDYVARVGAALAPDRRCVAPQNMFLFPPMLRQEGDDAPAAEEGEEGTGLEGFRSVLMDKLPGIKGGGGGGGGGRGRGQGAKKGWDAVEAVGFEVYGKSVDVVVALTRWEMLYLRSGEGWGVKGKMALWKRWWEATRVPQQ